NLPFVDAHNKCCLWCLEHFLLSYPALSYNTSTFFFFVCVCVFPAEIREAFKVFDRDGNGFHLKTGAGMAMRSLGYMPNEVELEVIIQRLDMDGQIATLVDFEEFVTLLFNGTDFDSVFWKCDMQKLTNIIMTEENHIENPEDCQVDIDSSSPTQQVKQTCVRKSLICAFAIAFIISVMLIAANQVLRSGMK
uniref:Calcium binding protein 7 n=1 Tax=Sphaeramia orbicularis TaxID=375764 RepID=A0A672YGQ9_9TELE